jgi:hypothetical protein
MGCLDERRDFMALVLSPLKGEFWLDHTKRRETNICCAVRCRYNDLHRITITISTVP